MTELNPLLEAMNSIDDNIVSNSMKKPRSRHRTLKLAIVAAAVITAGVFVGATVVGSGNYLIKINNKERTMVLDTYGTTITIPAEYNRGVRGMFFEYVDVPLDELFKKFDVSPIMTDKFSLENSKKPSLVKNLTNDEEFCLHIENPCVVVFWDSVELSSYIHSKTFDSDFHYKVQYYRKDYDCSLNIGTDDYEEVTLKDGSQCLVTTDWAFFAYDGALYDFHFSREDRDWTIKDIKQILKDFGVL